MHQEYRFLFLDMARANNPIRILGKEFHVPQSSTLLGKILSVELDNISEVLFGNKSVIKYKKRIRRSIKALLRQYDMLCRMINPWEVLDNLMTELKNNDSTTKEDLSACKNCAQIIIDFFCKSSSENLLESVRVAFELMQLLHYSSDSSKKHVIIFDNIERYIGTDEIFDNQVVEVFKVMRGVIDSYNNYTNYRYGQNFQIIFAMRKTTLRMFTPQQIADYLPHVIDLTDWFPIEKILELKIKWYGKNEYLLSEKHRILLRQLKLIIKDFGRTGDILRGLRLKLNQLFNNNKRLLLDYTLCVLEDSNNQKYITQAEFLYSNEMLSLDLRKHCFRSILWRLICDGIRKDAFFEQLSFEGHFTGNKTDLKSSYTASTVETQKIQEGYLNYFRKILTILHNAALHNQEMVSFPELIDRLYPGQLKTIDWLLSDPVERSKLAKILYLLNYNNRHDTHWFRYIDIQCNNEGINGRHISNSSEFEERIINNSVVYDLKIQITYAGEAYLGYIIQSFEQFSSFYYNFPPLFCVIPQREELIDIPVEELKCYTIVKEVSNKSKQLCAKLSCEPERSCEIDYLKNNQRTYISYSERLKNAHEGYIKNYCDVIKQLYPNGNRRFRRKRDELVKKILKEGLKSYLEEK